MSSESTSIKHILFDAVGTLIYPEPSVSVVYWRVGKRHGSRLSQGEIASRFATAYRRHFQDDTQSLRGSEERLVWQAVVVDVLADVPAAGGQPFVELWDHFAQPESWRMFADVEPTLLALQRLDVELSIASNFDSRLHSVVQGLQLKKYFENVFCSGELGVAKPHRQFYQQVLSAVGLDSDSVLMVGDSLPLDVEAAREVGLNAVLLDRELAHEEDVRGSSEFNSLATTAISSLLSIPNALR